MIHSYEKKNEDAHRICQIDKTQLTDGAILLRRTMTHASKSSHLNLPAPSPNPSPPARTALSEPPTHPPLHPRSEPNTRTPTRPAPPITSQTRPSISKSESSTHTHTTYSQVHTYTNASMQYLVRGGLYLFQRPHHRDVQRVISRRGIMSGDRSSELRESSNRRRR
jgi:hypothetical protein